ncbi:hypothetical protein E4U52_008020 [Claviceps spartinae]|nr:hypothetical protein E4U52_008020 [Claviceps spartinae]
MAPVKSKKRVSDRSITSPTRTNTKVLLKSPTTPTGPSPVKQHTIGLNAQQKQALIDNIQLEITERARRLRAQYQLQAQGLRSRIEIRINRIPMSLRKLKIGDLLQKHAQQEQSKNVSKPPPIPAKDAPVSAPPRHLLARSLPTGRGYKRMSNEISGNKENAVEHVGGTKKRARIPPVDNGRLRPGQVLSPTSSNSRLTNRDRHTSPTKSFIARPGSPLKASGTSRSAATTTTANLLSSMVEKAKANRAKGTKKVFTTSEMSNSSTTGTTAASRARRNGGATAAKAASYRPGTRNGRRASNTSETSEGSAGTVATKASLPLKAGPQTQTTKSSVMGSIRKGMTGGTRKAVGAAATTKSTTTPATTAAGGRVLRKRG